MSLKDSISYSKLKEVITDKGYSFFTGEMNINLIGIRTSNKEVNEWNDYFIIAYQHQGANIIKVYDEFTTDPGIYYLKNKLLNSKGCAILKEGQYKGVYKRGLHGVNQYPALVQLGGKVTVYRDRNKDNILDFDNNTLDTGYFGINIHHGYNQDEIGPYSAGCQVFKKISSLNSVLNLVKKSESKYGKTFTYTLLNESDLQ